MNWGRSAGPVPFRLVVEGNRELSVIIIITADVSAQLSILPELELSPGGDLGWGWGDWDVTSSHGPALPIAAVVRGKDDDLQDSGFGWDCAFVVVQ